MYNNIQKWEWRNINDGKIYLDEQTKRNAISMRNSLMRLSESFAKQGDTLKAKEVLDLSLEKLPIEKFDHYSLSLGYPEMYYKLGDVENARKTTNTLLRLFEEKAVWLSTFNKEDTDIIFEDIDITLYMYSNVLRNVKAYETDSDYVKSLETGFMNLMKLFSHLVPEAELIEQPKDSLLD